MSININNSIDPNYRYKMPIVIIKVEKNNTIFLLPFSNDMSLWIISRFTYINFLFIYVNDRVYLFSRN